jgi:hypothetical protein
MARKAQPNKARTTRQHEAITAARINGRYALAAAVSAAAIGAILTAFFTNGFGMFAARGRSTIQALPASSSASTPAAPVSPSGASGGPTGKIFTEIADVRDGIPVFSDDKGTPAGVRNIPIGQRVQVLCKAKNYSGESSINFFYLLETPPWRGDYASANSFANGAPVGVTTHADPVDPKVPDCAGS